MRVLFGEVVETWRGWAWLEEVGPPLQGWASDSTVLSIPVLAQMSQLLRALLL